MAPQIAKVAERLEDIVEQALKAVVATFSVITNDSNTTKATLKHSDCITPTHEPLCVCVCMCVCVGGKP